MRITSVAAFAAFVILPAASWAEQPVADPDTGCQIRDHYPDPGRAIRWTGACKDGFANGFGVLHWTQDGRPDGHVEGTYLDGRLEGRARVAWTDGRRLVGSFVGGLMNGQGSFRWPDGRRYDGDWKDDRRTGRGTLTLPDGSRYVGGFRRNRPTGDGVFVTADGHHVTPRVDARGNVSAGAPLPRPPESAALATPRGGSFEDWLQD
ncbi:hypothetical protein HL658_13780 [Azospirillum sp. RWY-5-1]|uniref:MORN repeat-containing protein n=1 Tax=Azospirillum oleiclasticum TaxID=2735135 RepID=A0ABX2TDJ2_9PROT|nr:hypothetical protein [Azospirillum oleiclasticum]NYZ13620.1 hypothetical protein [Azospirillum oleiclasticum]NYZ20780.1 hypothetical protein [Azospirillum oleiclasticum]